MYHQPNTSKTDCPPYHNIYVLILLCKNYTDILKYDTTRNFIRLVKSKCINRFCEENQYEIHTLFLLCLELKFYVCIINCFIISFVEKRYLNTNIYLLQNYYLWNSNYSSDYLEIILLIHIRILIDVDIVTF